MTRLCHLPQKKYGPEARERSEPIGATVSSLNSVLTQANNQGRIGYFWDNTNEGQCARLLDVLRVMAVTSLEARENLKGAKPHEVVAQLRDAGYNIQASFRWMVYPDGVRRYATQYKLKTGQYQPWVGNEGELLW